MTDYNKLTVVNLKALLKERGIAQTGLTRKAQYVEALENADAANNGEDDALDASEEQKEDSGENGVEREEVQLPVKDVETEQSPEAKAQPEEQSTKPDETDDGGRTDGLKQSDGAEPPIEQVGQHPTSVSPPSAKEEAKPVSEDAAAPDTQASNDAPETLTHTSTLESVRTEEMVEDRLKRKRRSASPPILDSEVVKKKLRQDDDDGTVHLKEDASAETTGSGNVAEDSAAATNAAKVPDGSSFVASTVVDIDTNSAAPTKEREGRYKGLLPPSKAKTDLDGENEEADDRTVAPSTHPATSAIYISNLQRPLNPSSLRSHLVTLAAPPSGEADPDMIRAFFVDSVKSHAFALFDSLTAASRVRASLHDRAWPAERDRKPLWVDFIPEEKCEDWIELENDGSRGLRPGATRWEVSYGETNDGYVTADLVEFGAGRTGSYSQPIRRATDVANGHRQQGAIERKPSLAGTRPEAPRTAAPPLPDGEAQKFGNLDKLFSSTTAKPKLYFLPVANDLAEKRLDEIDRLISRDWSAKRASAADDEQLRRYTFEDGDVLVDSGFHPMPGRGRGGFGGGGPSRRGGGGFGRGRDDGGYGSYRPR